MASDVWLKTQRTSEAYFFEYLKQQYGNNNSNQSSGEGQLLGAAPDRLTEALSLLCR